MSNHDHNNTKKDQVTKFELANENYIFIIPARFSTHHSYYQWLGTDFFEVSTWRHHRL